LISGPSRAKQNHPFPRRQENADEAERSIHADQGIGDSLAKITGLLMNAEKGKTKGSDSSSRPEQPAEIDNLRKTRIGCVKSN